jgi:hypothetical protein
MHLHLPKPLHGWRQFVGEVGIIVLGVLIALGAEQIVESIHDRYLAQQAEDQIRGELAYNSAMASERVAIGDCMRASFADLRQRLIASGDDWPGLQNTVLTGAGQTSVIGPFFATAPPLSSPHRLWPTSAWAAATTSGAFSRGAHHFFNYAALYAMVDWLGRLQDHEIADYSRLMPFDVPQKLDPSARLQLLRDIGTVDADNADIERLAAVLVRAARHNGMPPDPTWLGRVLHEEALGRGACVKQGPSLDAAVARDFSSGLHL